MQLRNLNRIFFFIFWLGIFVTNIYLYYYALGNIFATILTKTNARTIRIIGRYIKKGRENEKIMHFHLIRLLMNIE